MTYLPVRFLSIFAIAFHWLPTNLNFIKMTFASVSLNGDLSIAGSRCYSHLLMHLSGSLLCSPNPSKFYLVSSLSCLRPRVCTISLIIWSSAGVHFLLRTEEPFRVCKEDIRSDLEDFRLPPSWRISISESSLSVDPRTLISMCSISSRSLSQFRITISC